MSAVWEEAVRCHREGNFAEADQLYYRVLREAEVAEDKNAYEIARYHLARVAFDGQDNAVAVRRFNRLLEIQEYNGDNRGVSRTYRYLAELYIRQDDLERAVKMAEKSYDIVEGVWDREQMASSKHLLGILYQKMGEDSKAISSLRESQAIWEEIPNEAALLQTTLVLADVYEDQGNLPIAVRAIKQALKLLSQEDDVEEIAELHFRLAQASLELKDNRATLTHLLACLGRHRVLQSPLLQRDIEAVQHLRGLMEADDFWGQILNRIGDEGTEQFRFLLNEYFPQEEEIPEPKNLVKKTVSVDEPSMETESVMEEDASIDLAEVSIEELLKSEDPHEDLDDTEEEPSNSQEEMELKPHEDETKDELSSFGGELLSEEYSRTQELSKHQTVKKEAPPVVVNWEEEDVDRTESSLFVDTKSDFIITDITRSKIHLAEVEINNNFYRHFVASFFGVLIALLLVQWILV